MKIALITSFFKPIGGQELVTKSLFNQLRNAGHTVYVITTRNAWLNSNSIITLETLRRIPEKLLIPGTPLTDYLIAINLAEKLRKIQPNIIHVQDEYILPAVILANKLLSLPCVCSCHNNVSCFSNKSAYSRERITTTIFKMRKKNYISCLKHVDAIISVSEYIKKELISVGVESTKITTIYNVHDFPDDMENKGSPTSPKSNTVLFALGRLVWYKGFEVLIEAMKIISPKDSNIKLIIAGNGIELQHLKHLVATYKLEHSVSFTGKVSEIELIKLYKEADIVLLPSIFPDPAPLISMEAMYYGKPLIASNIGGIPESVNHGVNGFLVPPNDPKKTANAILELVNNPGLRYHMGKKGREEFEKKFSNDELISRTLKLYQTQL